MPQKFFVTGATGFQGGYVARELVRAGQEVRAIARDPTSEAALALSQLGVTVFQGDFDSVESMTEAAKGCNGVFINVSPSFTDPAGEKKHAANVLEACKNAGIKRIVQSSVGLMELYVENKLVRVEETAGGFMSNYLANKLAVENLVKEYEAAEQWTIIRCPRLLNSYISPQTKMLFPALEKEQTIRTALGRETKQSVLDPLDVGRVTTEALLEKEAKFRNRTFTLAVADMNMREIVDAMNAALGSEMVKLEFMGDEEAQKRIKEGDLITDVDKFLEANERSVDQKVMKWVGVSMTSAKAFFDREKAGLLKGLGQA